MQISDYQKYLKVTSIIDLISGGLTLAMGVMALTGAAMTALVDPAAIANAGADVTDAALALGGTGLVLGSMGLVSFFSGLFSFLEGILGLRASKDATQIMPVWYFAVVNLAFAGVSIAAGFALGSAPLVSFVHIALSVVMFWAANNIKCQLYPSQVSAA